MNFESLSLRVLSALFNGGYQGLLLTAIVWLGLRLWPHTNAATRHAAGLATLIVVAALPVVHFLATGGGVVEGAGGHDSNRPPATRSQEDRPRAGIGVPSASRVGDKEAFSVPRALIPRRFGADLEAGFHHETALPLGRDDTEPASSVEGEKERSTALSSAAQRWQTSVPARVALGLAGLWAVFAALRLAKLTGECRHLCALKRRSADAPERLGMAFESLRREMRVGRQASLLLVPGPAAPMAVGFLKPAVLLPAGLFRGSTWGALDQILRHELAHLRRGDDWANLVQQLIGCVLFFHPAVWWLSRHLTLDREIACDDHVLAAVPAPRAYALFLTEFAGRDHYRNCSAAPAGWSRKSQLQQRITMILDSNRNASTALAKARAGIMITAAALLAAFSLHAAPRLELSRATASGADDDAGDSVASSRSATLVSALADSGAEAVISSDGVVTFTGPTEPKVKAGVAVNVDARPNPVPQPKPVVVVTPDVRPGKPLPAPAPYPMAHPVPARAPLPDAAPLASPHPVPAPALAAAVAEVPWMAHPKRVAGLSAERDESIEQRLDRLERMIESLLQNKGDRAEPGKEWKMKSDANDFGMDMKWDFKMDTGDWESLRPDKIEQITRQAQQQAAQAAQHAQRIAEEAQRSAMNAYNRAMRHADSHEHQRRMLESQRHSLERQLGNLEAQIAQLEAARDQMEAQVEQQDQLIEQLEEQIEHTENPDHDDEEDGEDIDNSTRDRKPPRP